MNKKARKFPPRYRWATEEEKREHNEWEREGYTERPERRPRKGKGR